MAEIQSEAQFFWKIFKEIIILPYTLIQVIFGKKKPRALLRPVTDFFKFIFEPKFALTVSIINIIAFIVFNYLYLSGYIDDLFVISNLVFKPSDILALNFIPFVSAWFMHGSVAHLLGNVLVIMVMGRVVERRLGFGKTALIYFGAGIISNVFSAIIYLFVVGNNAAGIGASGCAMGLVAAAILLDPLYISFETIIPLPVTLLGLLYIWSDITGVFLQAQDNIGHFAHIGGFISVFLIMYLFNKKERDRMRKGMIVNAAMILIILALYFFLKGNII